MSLAFSRSDSGLILAQQSMDAAAIERALKRKDPDLELQGWPDQEQDTIVWKVVRAVPDRPPETICVWQSDRGEIYPLSSGILDMVDRLDKNTRSVYLDEDTLNTQKAEREKKATDQATDDLIADWEGRDRTGRIHVFPRSPAFAAARRRGRKKGQAFG